MSEFEERLKKFAEQEENVRRQRTEDESRERRSAEEIAKSLNDKSAHLEAVARDKIYHLFELIRDTVLKGEITSIDVTKEKFSYSDVLKGGKRASPSAEVSLKFGHHQTYDGRGHYYIEYSRYLSATLTERNGLLTVLIGNEAVPLNDQRRLETEIFEEFLRFFRSLDSPPEEIPGED